jgi:hypothetical protein
MKAPDPVEGDGGAAREGEAARLAAANAIGSARIMIVLKAAVVARP